MKSFKFIFLRFSAFLFDMITLSFLIAMFLTVTLDILGMEIGAVDVVYQLSLTNGVFKSLLYLSLIGIYYGLHVFFRRATFGLWLTHQDFAEKLPSIAKAASEDEDMVQDVVKSKVTFHKRAFNAFLYSSFQMINVALLGVLTIYAAFQDTKVAYHESVSGVRIITRNNKSK